jgi:hypothetical protein
VHAKAAFAHFGIVPWLYLKGVSTGQFEEALTALSGPDAPGLSASTVRRPAAVS